MVNNILHLEKRVRYFVRTRTRHTHQLVDLIEQMSRIGEVALFGGVLRDLSLDDINCLASDVDIVVKPYAGSTLSDAISAFSPTRNSFGGYRLNLEKWYVDAWEFLDTWAFRQGLVAGHDFKDLLATTFFNWDAIVYDVAGGKIICRQNYLSILGNRILDINLEENPNIAGAVVRALRALIKFKPKLTRRLATYIYMNGTKIGRNELLEIDNKDHIRRCLSYDYLSKIFKELEIFLSNNESDLFQMQDDQIGLFADIMHLQR